jgi:hypothetical protein
MQYYIPISTHGTAAVDGQTSKSFVDWITTIDTNIALGNAVESTMFTGWRK